jgi:hypothetical protein
LKYHDFLKFADSTGFKENQYFLLWRTWRFEKVNYTEKALKEFFAINPKCKNVKDMFKVENTNIGVYLKKYRRLRVVSQEGINENIYNMDMILKNCDIGQDEDIQRVYFPLVFIKCDNCQRMVYKFQSEGVWCCVCENYWIDAFYNVDTIHRIWGIKDQTTPEKNISIVEKSQELPF